MKKIKIRKKDIIYMIIGRITVFLGCYIGIEILLYKAFIYILDNCITTLR